MHLIKIKPSVTLNYCFVGFVPDYFGLKVQRSSTRIRNVMPASKEEVKRQQSHERAVERAMSPTI